MKISITYCTQWNYLSKASSLGENLQKKCNAEIELLAGSGGALEISIDGLEIFSKKKTGHFPTVDEIYALIIQL